MNTTPDRQSIAFKLTMTAVGFYLLFSPVWLPAIAPRMYDNARVLQLGFLVLLTALVPVPAVSAALVPCWLALSRGARWLIAVFLAGGAISAAVSVAPQIGALQIGLVTLLVVLFFLVCVTVRALRREAETVLAVAIFAGAGLVVLKFWVTYVLYLVEGKTFSWVSPFLDFANVRFFGQYQAYALLLVTLPVVFLALSPKWRIFIYFVAASFWSLQWMVGSRAVWVGFAAATAVISLFMRQGRARWLAEQGGLAVAGGVIYLLFSSLILSSPNATPIPQSISIVERGGESANQRIILAKAALRLVGEHPLAGVGPGQFGLHYSITGAAHPHNAALQLLSEYGLVAGMAGVALGLLAVLFAVRRLRTGTLREIDPVGASLCAALVMGLIDALLSGNLVMPHSQVLLCVIAGWIVGRAQRAGGAYIQMTGGNTTWRLTLTGVTVLAALTTTILALEYLDVIRHMAYPPELRIPSFWQYGRFDAW